MKVTFYGTGSAIPSASRGFACIGIRVAEGEVLLDCGDGSIHKLVSFGADVNQITNILVTHHHSDHLTGLTSIIETMAIRRRTQSLKVYGPPGLAKYFESVRKATNVASNKMFEIVIREISPGERLSVGDITVRTYEMDHTIPCIGYRLERKGTAIAYTGDTEPCLDVLKLSRDSDLLIHEATYLKSDSEKARHSKHSTPAEAAIAARDSGAKRLIMTHINDGRETPREMLAEASKIFSRCKTAEDGMELSVSR